jgi:hypothetical protein
VLLLALKNVIIYLFIDTEWAVALDERYREEPRPTVRKVL